MNEQEFLQRYTGKTRELVVRISWCWTKKSGPFSKVGELFCARARFDQALDVQSDTIIGKSISNWMEWLTQKHVVGHPYGHDFKEGHLYRVLVREEEGEAPQGLHPQKNYLLERVLEKDVNEPRLDPYVQFADGFCGRELDRYLLIEDGASGWANCFGYRRTSVRYIGCACAADDEPVPCIGRLCWMERERGSHLKTRFDKMGVYRVRVREGKQDSRQLMLVELLGKVRDARFDGIAAAYLKPVVLNNHLGTFTLDRTYDWYTGEIDYLGKSCEAVLLVESGETEAGTQMAKLAQVCADLADIDQRVREYAADEMLEDASDWCGKEIDRAEFMKAIMPVSVNVEQDGSVEFAFDDAGIFKGHTILVQLNSDGEFEEAYIAG